MADEVVRLPGSSYEELVKIIQAYGSVKADDDAELQEISQRTGMHPTAISRNSAFLAAIGLVEGGKRKRLSDAGRELALAFVHNMADEITSKWRALLVDNEFVSKIVTAVRIRNGMDPSTLRSHIAYTAGVTAKTPRTETGARAVIDLLVVARMIEERDGKYVVSTFSDHEASRGSSDQKGPLVVSSPGSLTQRLASQVFPGASHESGGVNVSINLQVQIQCTAEEVEYLGPRLRKMLADLARPPDDEEDGVG